jgi:3-hydroxybutyryl-CoA dehydratase
MQELPSSTLLVSADVIRAYAELTQDFNPLHLDPQFAAATPMGGVIAHGTLSINLVCQSLLQAFGPSALEGADFDLRFVKPVRIGESLVAGGTRDDDTPRFTVWVRGPDGDDRIVGSVQLPGRG